MTSPHQTDWQEPLEFAADFAGNDNLVFLHSSLIENQSRPLSILALEPAGTITQDWQNLEAALQNTAAHQDWRDCWFGWLGYELKDQLERFTPLPESFISLPDLWMTRFKTVFLFDHHAQTILRYGPEPPRHPVLNPAPTPPVQALHSNMSKAQYLEAVKETLAQIHAGEFYQANITRKFYGTFTAAPEPYVLFQKLQHYSPAPYSAFIKADGKAIVSSSPECFLTLKEDGNVETRPIKGTAPRGKTPAEDDAIRNRLAKSRKDAAENLMIVDLMRNDLSRCCDAGTVSVTALHSLHRYETLYHLVSTVTGQRQTDKNALDVVKSCFPPGSMTGAPKIRVMQHCAEWEKIQRGIYSGALGWLSPKGSGDLSVVIRTAIFDEERFEFQVGGGIVADSEPESEWRETLTKALGITRTLEIPLTNLASL